MIRKIELAFVDLVHEVELSVDEEITNLTDNHCFLEILDDNGDVKSQQPKESVFIPLGLSQDTKDYLSGYNLSDRIDKPCRDVLRVIFDEVLPQSFIAVSRDDFRYEYVRDGHTTRMNNIRYSLK